MRPLTLHVSALTDDEYALYTASLGDLATSTPDAAALPHNSSRQRHDDDARCERTLVGVREARAWLRGRYSDLPASDIDTILRFFYPNLLSSDTITGGQFFAALRLVLHAKSGKGVDRALAFVQPSTGPSRPPTAQRSRSPSRRPVQAPPSHPDRHKLPPPTTPPDSNPFVHRPVEHPPVLPDPEPAPVPLQQRLGACKVSRNPFVVRDKSEVDKAAPDLASGRGRLPPLPPRKSAPRRPSEPAPISASGPPLIPLKPTHVMSPLMRQSLEASKHAQSIKRVEEQLDRERVLQVLKTTSSNSSISDVSPPRTRSLSPSKLPGSGPEDLEEAPPLPRRQGPSPPPSTSSSVWSLDEVAGATLPSPLAPYRPPLPSRDVSAHVTTHGPIPPPRHPHRRPSTSTEPNVNDSSSSSASSRVVRSKSVTASAPPPPPRRKRPESMQLTPTDVSFPPNSPHVRTSSFQGLVRHPSLSRDKEREDSTMSHIQRTLTNLQLKAQPRLDAVRYKAEAGISKRGYVPHTQMGHRWRDEGEQGLMADARWTAANVDRGSDSEPTTDSEPSAEASHKAANRGFMAESDNLKWPTGEGWAPL